jgi:N-methylhydantoinase B
MFAQTRLPEVADRATVNIVTNALHNIAQEMGINLLRSARSTIIREARDMSCALLDNQGRIVAEAEHVPVQMSSLTLPLRSCLTKHPIESVEPGDVFITNDPFAGGQHLQDIILFSPIFINETVFAFAGSIAHHIDIGGGSAGLTFDAREMYQEGLRFPSMKVKGRDFAPGGLIHDLVFGNFREPQTTTGDLRAQLAANFTGWRRLENLVTKFGAETIEDCFNESLMYSERLTRQAILKIPNGTYESEDQIDSGVFSDKPIWVRLHLTVEDEELRLDFAGTDPQVPEFLNVPLGSTVSAAQSAVKMILSSGGHHIPANDGSSRPVRLEVPYGTLLNPAPPAAVRARMCGAYRVFDAVLRAFQKAIPERVPALGFHVNTTSGFSRFADGQFRIFIEDIGGGWGATPVADGADMLDAPLSNCKITPIEALELDHPYLMVRRYELLPDSGGAGRFRGGLGSVREYEVMEEGVRFFGYADRHRFPPSGAQGGRDGTCGSFKRVAGDRVDILPSKIATSVRPGERIQVVAGGGGGFGDPVRRAPADWERDLRLGKATKQDFPPREKI